MVTRVSIGIFAVSSCVMADACTGAGVPSSSPHAWSGCAWEMKMASGRISARSPRRFSPKSHRSRKPSASTVKAEWPAWEADDSST